MRVRLETRAGALVNVLDAPDFDPPAEVIIWGRRLFVSPTEGQVVKDGGRVYRECMLWYAPAPPAAHGDSSPR